MRIYVKQSCIISLYIFFFNNNIKAQELPKGKLLSKDLKTNSIVFYDRNLTDDGKVFQTDYIITNTKKNQIYEINLSHDINTKTISITLNSPVNDTKITEKPIVYNPDKAGLIFTNESYLDTAINSGNTYEYLISFQDTARKYAFINKILTENDNILELDKLSSLLLKDHIKMVNSIYVKEAKDIQNKEQKQRDELESNLKNETAALKANLETEKKLNKKLYEDLNTANIEIDTLIRSEYSFKIYPNIYTSENGKTIDTLSNRAIYKMLHSFGCDEFDLSATVTLNIDTSGNISYTNYFAALNQLDTKQKEKLSTIVNAMKEVKYPVNYIYLRGKSFPVKTTYDKQLSISLKNKKDKYIVDTQNTISSVETHLPVEDKLKIQFNRFYPNLIQGKFKIKLCSINVGNIKEDSISTIEMQ